ncbi:unnamed protein product [Oppiella nova]|uniref:Uncharacterized protein n=1 Tax=Oppiella nova TaxID=334625 RepID=A0A7R9MKG4_9ACAR|nr:unnamed protein product [Oppiella nova]CAG2179039.1 unnamed protein product [Oppiella nova]
MGSGYSTTVNNSSFGTHSKIYVVVKRGDIIEIQMSWGYKHWVICEYKSGGNVWCYHLAPEDGSSAAKMFLRKVPLLDILVDDNGEGLYLCRVNNQDAMAAAKGLIALPLELVFPVLEAFKDHEVEYEPWLQNSGFYCTLFKYGAGWSTRVTVTEMVVGGVVGVVGVAALAGGAAVISMGTITLLAVMAYFGIKYFWPERAIQIGHTINECVIQLGNWVRRVPYVC